jgi:hypothetical protein
MTDAFHFTRTASTVEPVWQVRVGGPGGRVLGTVAMENGGYQASHVAPGGKLHLHWSADRDAAARWLASIAPKHTSRR